MAVDSMEGGSAQGVRRPRGFFGRLFDLSLREFVTPDIASWLFTLSVVAGGLVAMFLMVLGAREGFLGFLLGTVSGAVVFLVWALTSRLYFETIVVLFRIEEHVRDRAARPGGRR